MPSLLMVIIIYLIMTIYGGTLTGIVMELFTFPLILMLVIMISFISELKTVVMVLWTSNSKKMVTDGTLSTFSQNILDITQIPAQLIPQSLVTKLLFSLNVVMVVCPW